MDGALVGLVEHDDRVLRKGGVEQALTQEHTVCHVGDLGLGAGAVLETNGVADLLTQTAAKLFGNTLGNRHGCNTTRLGAANLALERKTLFRKVLCHLRRLIAGCLVFCTDQTCLLTILCRNLYLR